MPRTFLHCPTLALAIVLASYIFTFAIDQEGLGARYYRFPREIQELAQGSFGIKSDLGAARPESEDAVESMARKGDAAIPDLLRALKSPRPILAGYAAFTLSEMRYQHAARRVSEALASFKRQKQTEQVQFAVTLLDQYLRFQQRAVDPE